MSSIDVKDHPCLNSGLVWSMISFIPWWYYNWSSQMQYSQAYSWANCSDNHWIVFSKKWKLSKTRLWLLSFFQFRNYVTYANVSSVSFMCNSSCHRKEKLLRSPNFERTDWKMMRKFKVPNSMKFILFSE